MRILIKYIGLLLLLMSTMLAKSQQDPIYSQYMNNPVSINPAYAGTRDYLNISSIFRKQWVNIDGSPMTTTLSVHGPFRDAKVGLGMTFINDQIGPVMQNGLYLDYAYYLRFDKRRTLSLGLKGGFNHYNIDYSILNPADYDSWLSQREYRPRILPNVGIGVYYYSDDWYIGAAIPKLIRNSLVDKDNTLEAVGREERHAFLMGGYVFTINDPDFKIKPAITTGVVNGSPVTMELSATFIFYEKAWFGLLYRFGDAVGAHLRLQLTQKLQLGYAYDMTRSRLKYYNSGTHEIFLSFDFVTEQQRIFSPRFF